MRFLYILLAILVFGLLIFIHELGHFICARLCGVGVNEFAIGMGPKVISWVSKKSGIRYSIRALPLGGYVSMVGEDEESEREDAFSNRSVWKRILIVSAGPIMNLLLGFLAMAIMVVSSKQLASTQIVYLPEDGVCISDETGLDSEDIILKVGNVSVHTGNELCYEVAHQGDAPLSFTVLRNGEKLVVNDVLFTSEEESGVTFGKIDFRIREEAFSFGNVMKHTFFRSVSMVKMIIDSFADLLQGRYGVEAMSGPVGMTQSVATAAEDGFSSLLNIFVLITINLGVFNLFPIPALDGGRLLFLLIEAVTRRRVNKDVEGYIHFAGLVLLLGLILFVTFNDVIKLF